VGGFGLVWGVFLGDLKRWRGAASRKKKAWGSPERGHNTSKKKSPREWGKESKKKGLGGEGGAHARPVWGKSVTSTGEVVPVEKPSIIYLLGLVQEKGGVKPLTTSGEKVLLKKGGVPKIYKGSPIGAGSAMFIWDAGEHGGDADKQIGGRKSINSAHIVGDRHSHACKREAFGTEAREGKVVHI